MTYKSFWTKVRDVICVCLIVATTFTDSFSQFSYTVVPTPSSCPRNGKMVFTSNCSDPGATFLYNLVDIANGASFTTNVVSTVSTTLCGLPPGTYDVTGEKLLNGVRQMFVRRVTIANTWNPINFTVSITPSACGDGKITVNVAGSDLANVQSYEIAGLPPQTSNQFCDLAPGTYFVHVNHALCPDMMPIEVTVPVGVSDFFASGTLIEKVSCDSVKISNNILSRRNRNFAIPIIAEHTICPPGGLPSYILRDTITTVGRAGCFLIADYCDTYQIKSVFRDRCGVTVIRNTTRRVDARESQISTGACGVRLRLHIFKLLPPYTVTVCQAPAGFNPTLTGSGSTYLDYHSTANPAPFGDYIIKVTDACTTHELDFTVRPPNPSVSVNPRPSCTPGLGTGRLNSNTGFVSAQIIAGPAGYTGPLPLDLTDCLINTSQIITPDLAAGVYTIQYVDLCGLVRTRLFSIREYFLGEAEFDLNIRCGSFDFFFSQGNLNINPSYNLERLDPATGNWLNQGSVNNGFVNGAYFTPGCYRIRASWLGYVKPDLERCYVTVQEFKVDYQTTLASANAFQCEDGTVDVIIQATGPYAVTYCISEINGVPQVPNISNGSNPVFPGLAPGVYTFLVKDECGTIISSVLDVTALAGPSIMGDLCGEDGFLCVEGFDLLNFRWWEISNPGVTLSNIGCLEFPSFDAATAAGTYFLEVSYSGVNSCIFDTLSFTIPNDVFDPDPGEDGGGDYCGVDNLDLFTYLGGTPDPGGTWSVVSGNASISGSQLMTANLMPGVYQFKYSVNSICGGMAMSLVTLTILDFEITCNDVKVFVDDQGCANLNADDLIATNSCVDATVSTALSISKLTCSDLGMGTACPGMTTVMAIATQTNSMIATCNSTVSVCDTIPPEAICGSITVAPNEVFPAVALDGGSTDNCSPALTFTTVRPFYECDALDGAGPGCLTTYIQELIVTDACGNSSACDAIVFVRDDERPTAICQNISVTLDANGNATIVPSDLDGGSIDNCPGDFILEISRSTFTCHDLSDPALGCSRDRPVLLTVTDPCGNQNFCQSVVTVSDVTPPVVDCKSITIQLDATGAVSVTQADLIGVSDNCNGDLIVDIPRFDFSCADLNFTVGCTATIDIPITVTDECENVSTCNASVTLTDGGGPTAQCRNLNRILDENGITVINASDLDAGSFDNCDVDLTLSTSRDFLSCADLTLDGAGSCVAIIPVTLTVTDDCGYTSSCISDVFIRDTSPPDALCRDYIAEFDGSGVINVPPSFLVGGSTDNCASPANFTLTSTQEVFTCGDLSGSAAGFETVVAVGVTVEDRCGNVADCMSNVTLSINKPCDMKCISQINLSLRSEDCAAEVQPDMVLPDVNTLCENPIFYTVVLTDEHGNILPHNQVTIDQIGKNLTYEIINNDPNCGNSCWGNVLVEYKHIPQLECPDTMVMTCAALEVLCLPSLFNLEQDCTESTFEVFLAHEERDVVECGEPGDDLYTHIITRQYRVKDAQGTVVNSCDQMIYLERIEPDEVKYPVAASINCSDLENFTLNDQGCPEPWLPNDDLGLEIGLPYLMMMPGTGTGSGTGSGTPGFMPNICVPGMEEQSAYGDHGHDDDTMGGGTGGGTGSGTGSGTPGNPMVIPLFPGSTSSCTGFVTYTDLLLPQIGCSKKFIRTWEVIEWNCGVETIMPGIPQVIEVIDDAGPVIDKCPEPFEVTTNDDCAGDIVLPTIEAHDGCDNGVNVKIEHPWGIVDVVAGEPSLATLETGKHVLTYKVTDNCYNETTCTTIVTIKDHTEPVAICEQNTVVSISQDGNTIVSSDVFDDGSWDECSAVTTCAMKMADVLHFRSLAADTTINGEKYVLKSAMDTGCLHEYVSGVEANGLTYVSEADLCVPYIRFCCTDVGVDQMVIFRALDSGLNHSDCMVNVEIQDKSVPSLTCPDDMTIDCRLPYDLANLSAQFGGPDIQDNCGNTQAVDEVVTPDVNQCGQGQIQRQFNITSAGQVVMSCKQLITIVNEAPFTPGEITWPADFTAVCGVLNQVTPEAIANNANYGEPFARPGFADADNCSLLGYDYEDEFFASDPINQECGVIQRHWTVIDWCTQVSGSFATFEHTQTIKIEDNEAPVILVANDTIVMSNNASCSSVELFLWRETAADCTPEGSLIWDNQIVDASGSLITTDINGAAIDLGDKDISATFGAGEYDIIWTVTDGCGNSSTTTQKLTVMNTKLPVPICVNGIAISLDSWGNAELWASDIDGGSYHPCGDNLPITLSFNAAGTQSSLDIACMDGQTYPYTEQIAMYVIDNQTGLGDFCTATVEIQDPTGACSDVMMVEVSGEIFTETLQTIEEVKVEMSAAMPFEMTDDNGIYAFGDMAAGGDYEVVPSKDDDHSNGVSTLDLILIQRHILGIEELDSPYKLIAADINSSEDVNGIDLVELRKLILGIYTEFPDNTSWRFVDTDHTFTDAANPWLTEIAETYDIIGLNSDMDIDFIGVKVGDVNGDLSLDAQDLAIDERNNRWPLVLEYEAERVAEGTEMTVPFYFRGYENVSGWQTTMEWDMDKLEVIELVTAETSEPVNYSLNSDLGLMTMSYQSSTIETKATDEVVFELRLRVKEDIDLAAAFELTSSITGSEAYRGYDEKVDLRLDTRIGEESRIIAVTPNPWITSTEMEFYIAKDGEGIWEFYDVNGRMLHTVVEQYEAGRHDMTLTRGQLQTTGVIYAKLTTDQGVSEYKMILVD